MESDTTYSFRLKDSLLGAQMLFVAFGALVLVPILTGMSTNVALFTAGVGTLIFQICTRGKVPVFLASSFAFIAPIIYGVQTWGLPATLGGMVVAGAVYVVLSFIIRWRGTEIIMRLLPPIVTGPVIIVIGLVLAPVGVNMALGKAGDGSAVLVPENTALIISMAALATTVLVSLLGRGMIRLIPIMSGIAVGYLCAIGLGIHDFSKVAAAPWFGVPDFVFPEFRWEAILFIIPITLAPAIEHFGDIIAISSVTGKDFLKDPGIKSTMLGDGIALPHSLGLLAQKTVVYTVLAPQGIQWGDETAHVIFLLAISKSEYEEAMAIYDIFVTFLRERAMARLCQCENFAAFKAEAMESLSRF